MNPLGEDLDYIIDHLGDIAGEFRASRIFITGGTGFFGTWLLESIAWMNRRLGLGTRATVLTRDTGSFAKKCPHLAEDPALTFIQGNVVDFKFPAGEFSQVIHAATQSSVALNEKNLLETFDTIVAGTRRVVDFARQSGVRKLLLTSSGAVYGRQPSELEQIPEDYPGAPGCTDPLNVYAEGKRAAELLCCAASSLYGFEAKIARCFAFVGPGLPLSAHFAIGNFIRDGMQGGPIVVKGDGTPYRSYLYAADLVIWLLTILAGGKDRRPYNVGSPVGLPVAEVARTVAGCFDPVIPVQVRKHADPAGNPERYVPSTDRAEQELGLVQGIDLGIAIRKTIAWNRRRA